MSHALTNWRRHAPHHRRYPVRYGRDPGFLSSTKGKVVMVAAAVGLGAAAFFVTRKSSAAEAPSSPTPTVPATPNPANPTPPPAAPPVSTSADLAKVVTHDPAPSGDLNLFDAPNGSRIGGAEKNSLVSVLSNDGTWAKIQTHNTENRYVDQVGFVHAQYLAAPDAQSFGTAAAQQATDLTKQVASLFSGL